MNTQYKKGVLELCVLALVLTEPKNTKSLRHSAGFFILCITFLRSPWDRVLLRTRR